MQDGHVETGFGSQIAELISDAGCCPHLGRFSPRNFLKRQRPQVTRPVATRKDVQAFLQQVRHAWLWEAGMQCNGSYILVYKHLHRLSFIIWCQHAERSRMHLHLCGSRHLPAAASLQVGTIQHTTTSLLPEPFLAAGAQSGLTACRLGAAVHFWPLPVHTVCKGPLVNEITRMPLSQTDYSLIVERMPEFERQLIQLQADVREQPCYLEDPAEPVLLAYARQYDVAVSLCGEVRVSQLPHKCLVLMF